MEAITAKGLIFEIRAKAVNSARISPKLKDTKVKGTVKVNPAFNKGQKEVTNI